jgi:hypothetical protein
MSQSPSPKETYEDIEKLTNEQVEKYLSQLTQSVATQFAGLVHFTKEMIKTQTRELTMLREFEALAREMQTLGFSESEQTREAEINTRTPLILAQLDLFRETLAEQNTQQAPDATS